MKINQLFTLRSEKLTCFHVRRSRSDDMSPSRFQRTAVPKALRDLVGGPSEAWALCVAARSALVRFSELARSATLLELSSGSSSFLRLWLVAHHFLCTCSVHNFLLSNKSGISFS